MKTLIVYDSLYGNTERIARAIDSAMPGEVAVQWVKDVGPAQVTPATLLIVGSPTQRGTATPAIRDFIASLPASTLRGARVAAFDTRLSSKWATLFGNAADRIARDVRKKGGILVASPAGFLVGGTEGPLQDGELEWARAWAETIGASEEHSPQQLSQR